MAANWRSFYVIACAALLAAAQAQPQHKWEWARHIGPPKPAPSQSVTLSAGKAVDACYRFFASIGQPPPKSTPTVDTSNTYHLIWVSFSPYGRFCYQSDRNNICSYHLNMRPQAKIERGKKKIPFQYPSSTEALVRIKKLAKQIGIPSNYSVVEVGQYDKRHPSKNKTGKADALFEYLPYGYRFWVGKNGCRIRIDPSDGLLLEYSRFKALPYVIETHVPKLSLAQAKAKADSLPASYRVGQLEPFEKRLKLKAEPPSFPCQLRYVFPNGRYGGVLYDGKAIPHRYRLAWIIEYPRGDRVFVDAVDGTILGGVTHLDHDWSK